MNLEGDKLNFETNYKKKYSKSISNYSKNNLIYSAEPYEFRIDGGTPNGKIIIPGKLIQLPCNVKKIIVEDNSVVVKDSKIISIDEIKKNNAKFIEAEINNVVLFNLRLYDEYDCICKMICYLDKYPTPDKQSFIKEFIAVYSIVITKVLISCDNDTVYNSNYDKDIRLRSRAAIKDIKCGFYKEQKDDNSYKLNYEAYINLLAGIVVDSQMEIFTVSEK